MENKTFEPGENLKSKHKKDTIMEKNGAQMNIITSKYLNHTK